MNTRAFLNRLITFANNDLTANIVENALHAMPGPGSLTIDGTVEGGMVRLEVTDTGVGMDQEALERVFEPVLLDQDHRHGPGPADRPAQHRAERRIDRRAERQGPGDDGDRQAADGRWISG